MNVAVAVARHLETLGLAAFDENGPTGDTFIGHMPSTPDQAVMIQPTGGFAESGTHGYDTPTVQITVRGGRHDPLGPQQRLEAIYDALHGLHAATLDPGGNAEVRVVSCLGMQSAPTPIGRDDNERHEFTLNFALHVRHLTAHRQ